MGNPEKISLDITIIQDKVTIKELDNLRLNLFNYLRADLAQQTTMRQPIASRSIDPVVIGTISLALLPIVVEKLADLIIKWIELRKDCSITIKIPVKTKAIEITYNPKTASPEMLKKWINDAVESIMPKNH